MSEMISRVAKAIEKQVGLEADDDFYDKCARAAILAMREPTEGMKKAGGMIPNSFKGTAAAIGNADRVWQSMIDEALR